MANDILDFTDYAKPIDFKFKDVIYRVPAFSKNQIETLMEANRKFIDQDEAVDDMVPKDGDKITKEQFDKTAGFFDSQDEFIAIALLKKEGDEFKPVDKSELEDWPVKVKNRVMQVITEQMSSTVDDEEEPSKKS